MKKLLLMLTIAALMVAQAHTAQARPMQADRFQPKILIPTEDPVDDGGSFNSKIPMPTDTPVSIVIGGSLYTPVSMGKMGWSVVKVDKPLDINPNVRPHFEIKTY